MDIMGTRSLTFVTENEAMPIMCMYRQMDGYPSGHGLELAEFLAPITIVNGIGDGNAIVANGAGCLAAQIVAHFKDGPGGIYLHRPNKHMDCWQDYEYWIDVKSDGIHVRVFEGEFAEENLIFQGNVQELMTFCSKEE